MLPREEILSRIDRILDVLQLEELRYRPVRTLSGVQKQLVAIAGILVMHPQIIIFDEASSMLDPQNTGKLLGVLSDPRVDSRTAASLYSFEFRVIPKNEGFTHA